jgi:hypothetical protein
VSENLFPTGHWTGFYAYAPQNKHRMDLHLTFARGSVAGEGNDDVGVFFIRGKYDTATKECYWTKSYAGGHDVFYRGFREGKGIWGKWEIDSVTTGGFHIWPRSEETDDLHAEAEKQAKPLDAGGVPAQAPSKVEPPSTKEPVSQTQRADSRCHNDRPRQARRLRRPPSLGYSRRTPQSPRSIARHF